MFYFLHALLIALILVGVTTLIALWGSKRKELTLAWGVGMVIFWTGIGWWILYATYPIIGFNMVAFYQSFWLWAIIFITSAVLLAIPATDFGEKVNAGSVVHVLAIVGVVLYSLFVATGGRVLGESRALSLAHQVHVVMEPAGSYPDTDPNHILMVPEQSADFEASNVLGSATQGNVSTIFNLGDGTLQSVDHHLYWLYPLVPSSWRNSNRVHGDSPGYVVVDAEDPNVTAQLKLGYHMHYYPGGRFDHSLARYLYTGGYAGSQVTDLTLEVNDQWKPYFTASVDKLTLNFKPMVPSTMLVVDPQTGHIQHYTLNDVPSWVDRIYSQDTVTHMLDWWGEWASASYNWWSESSANRFKVAPGEPPVLVYTTTGHPVWQAIMTSWNRDTSATYLALFDARDNEVRMYHIPDLTIMSTAASTIQSSPTNLRKLEPVHLTLHKIYGQLTWVAPMISESSTSTSKPNFAVQGIAFMKANVLDGNSVALANTGSKADSLTLYRQKLAEGDNNAGPQSGGLGKTTTGVIAKVSQTVENNSTVYYFILSADPSHVYRAALSANVTGSLELPFIAVGAHVNITYSDVGGNTSRDVGSYDDLGLHIR